VGGWGAEAGRGGSGGGAAAKVGAGAAAMDAHEQPPTYGGKGPLTLNSKLMTKTSHLIAV